MSEQLSPLATQTLEHAQRLSCQHRSGAIGPIELFLAALDVLKDDELFLEVVGSLGWNLEEARLYAASAIEPRETPDGATPQLSRGGEQVLRLAFNAARAEPIEPTGLFYACLIPQADPSLLEVLASLDWNTKEFYFEFARIKWSHEEEQIDARAGNHPLSLLTGDAQRAVNDAYQAMRTSFCGRISTAHMLLGLLSRGNRAVELLDEVGASTDELKARTRAAIRSDAILATPDKRFDKGAKRALDRAKFEARSRGYQFIGTDHLLLGLLPKSATVRERLTWGDDVRDEAAPVLAQVDGAKLHELAGPRATSRARVTKNPKRDAPAIASILGFSGACGAQFGVGSALWSSHLKSSPITGQLAIGTFLLILVGSGLGACWMLLRSRKKNWKTAWVSTFAGAFVGMMASFMLHG